MPRRLLDGRSPHISCPRLLPRTDLSRDAPRQGGAPGGPKSGTKWQYLGPFSSVCTRCTRVGLKPRSPRFVVRDEPSYKHRDRRWEAGGAGSDLDGQTTRSGAQFPYFFDSLDSRYAMAPSPVSGRRRGIDGCLGGRTAYHPQRIPRRRNQAGDGAPTAEECDPPGPPGRAGPDRAGSDRGRTEDRGRPREAAAVWSPHRRRTSAGGGFPAG
jgi:hypothetical protein